MESTSTAHRHAAPVESVPGTPGTGGLAAGPNGPSRSKALALESAPVDTSQLSALMDPYLEVMLELLEQIECDASFDVHAVHSQLSGFLRRASLAAGPRGSWRRIMYALVSWSDEVLINSPWEGAAWWNDHLLEVEFFNTRVAGQQFYREAHIAAEENDHTALRAYYVCVLLGFRGIYAHQTPAMLTQLRLPPTLAEWVAQQRDKLNVEPVQLLPVSLGRRLPGAQPVDLRKQIVWWSLALLGLLVINITIYRLAH